MLLRSVAATVLAIVGAAAQGRFPADRQPYSTPAEAADAESYLRSHPDDRDVVKRLLDYYEARWQTTGSDRTRLILWTIENHPDIDLDPPHDPRGLLLNPDDRAAYGAARRLWLEQARRYPDRARVLANAAVCLRLTDREAAAGWLGQAIALDPVRRGFLVAALGDVYAAAITGVSGMNPWEGPTSVDAGETTSDFARRARIEAGADAEIAGRTGWALYLTTEAFQRLNLSRADYDAIAEELLLKSAAFDFPAPARTGLLGTFYQRQEKKASGAVLPKSRIVTAPPEELAKRLVSRTTTHVVTGERALKGPFLVTVDIVVGTDGHVWKATPRNAPAPSIGSAASAAVMGWTYRPLQIEGEIVRFATAVELRIDTQP